MQGRWWRWRYPLGMAILLFLYLLLPLVGLGTGLTDANASQVGPGMTREQVEAILGRPNQPFQYPRRGGQLFWDANTLLGVRYVSLLVDFDPDGRVVRAKPTGFWRRPW
jgi:outer membrane protein assembly factor BamE (lipoprotein component of BamABCDE complex)